MASALQRKLIVVTGKGGVGKTTVSAALGLLAADRGLRTIVVEVADAHPAQPDAPRGDREPSGEDESQRDDGSHGDGESPGAAGLESGHRHLLATLLGAPQPPHGVEVELQEGSLWGLSIAQDRVLAEWLRELGGRVAARVLTSSSSFQYLIAAAPGAREMLSMIKVWELAVGRRAAEHAADYDLVILDAPATGHALAMLRAPQTYSAIAKVGPIARQSQQVRELLEDPARSAYLAVAQATEMAVAETLELQAGLRRELGRELDAVIVNGTLPRRFDEAELQRIAALDGAGARQGKPASAVGGAGSRKDSVTHSAARAAHTVHERARSQQRHIARLRRQDVKAVTVPFAFAPALDLAAVRRIAARLGREL
jgi:anion-transporting  ArsA/GET3 family ATPase